jgi:hypothetical protein
MIIFFCWVAWIWLLIVVFGDLFRRDISGWAKAGWMVEYVRTVAAHGGSPGEIERAKALLESGTINQVEFDQLKAKALS